MSKTIHEVMKDLKFINLPTTDDRIFFVRSSAYPKSELQVKITPDPNVGHRMVIDFMCESRRVRLFPGTRIVADPEQIPQYIQDSMKRLGTGSKRKVTTAQKKLKLAEDEVKSLEALGWIDQGNLRCEAICYHGSGHQSSTRCQIRGPHDIHECCYGSYEQTARWRGKSVFTGCFDEPPTEPKPRKRTK